MCIYAYDLPSYQTPIVWLQWFSSSCWREFVNGRHTVILPSIKLLPLQKLPYFKIPIHLGPKMWLLQYSQDRACSMSLSLVVVRRWVIPYWYNVGTRYSKNRSTGTETKIEHTKTSCLTPPTTFLQWKLAFITEWGLSRHQSRNLLSKR